MTMQKAAALEVAARRILTSSAMLRRAPGPTTVCGRSLSTLNVTQQQEQTFLQPAANLHLVRHCHHNSPTTSAISSAAGAYKKLAPNGAQEHKPTGSRDADDDDQRQPPNQQSKNQQNQQFVPDVPSGHLEEHRSPADGKPTFVPGPRGCRKISLDVHQMSDDEIVLLAHFEDHDAREEVLKRHIMDVDSCSYETACDTFDEMERHNRDGLGFVTLPYKAGIFSVVTLGILSIPMVFHLPTIEWFNAWAVTTDVPHPKDLETPMEVSIWSWNWMEPPLGTFSFILLCSQYAREKMNNLGVKPYTRWIKQRRGRSLADAFPRYDPNILIAYSETAVLSTSLVHIEKLDNSNILKFSRDNKRGRKK